MNQIIAEKNKAIENLAVFQREISELKAINANLINNSNIKSNISMKSLTEESSATSKNSSQIFYFIDFIKNFYII